MIDKTKLSNEVKQKYLLQNETFVTTVKDSIVDRIEVEIGDSKQPDFKPQFKISRWDNEVNFSLRAVEEAGAIIKTEGENIKYIGKDVEVHQYDKPDAGEDGGFEFEWVLKSKPASNVLQATIRTKGLKFYKQPPLTQFEIDKGNIRPENVLGSYAVYHESKRDNRIGGKAYRTGKAFHVYRPLIIDALGNKTYADLHIDVVNELLTVTIPQDFWDNATYPIVADPTIGYTSAGGSQDNVESDSNAPIFDPYTLHEDGNVSKITAYCRANIFSGTDFKAKAALYDSGKNLIGGSSEVTGISSSSQWRDFNMSNEAITPEQHYIAFTGTHTGGTGSDFMSLWYDTIPSSTSIYDTTAYGSLWPDPFVQDGAAAMQHSLYATYTSDYDYSYLQFASNTADQSSYTFSSQSLGAADSERYIIVGISTRKAGTGSMTLNSVTIGGVSATISVQKQSTVDGDTCLSAIVIAKVPTGTTGDVVVTFSETVLRCGITMYRAVDLASTTADDTGFGTADPPSTSIDIPATGLAIAESATGWTSVDGSWAGLNPAHVTEVEGMTMSGAMSAFDSSQTGHTITCDWSTENDPVIVAASFNFAAPTTTNDERAAKITGQQSTNDERAAKTTGQQLTSDERSAKVSGTDTTNDERSAKVTGQVSTNDERSGKVTGAATTNDERSGKVTGALGSNDERAGKVTGQLTTNDERAGKVTGTLTANDERDAKLTGTDTTNAERDAKITGQDTSNSERDAKVTGVEGSSDERSAKVTGTDTISDERSAKTTGTLAQNDQRSVKLTGNALTNDERAGKLTGIDTTNDERSAKTTGGLAASAERSAKLEGGEGGSSERSAKLTGANPNVEGEVYMEFVTPTVAI